MLVTAPREGGSRTPTEYESDPCKNGILRGGGEGGF